MALRNYSVLANPQALSIAVSASDTTFTVPATASYPAAPFIGVIERGVAGKEEVFLCTAKPSGTTLTVTRGYDGSTATTHAVNSSVEHGVSAIEYREANVHVNANSPHMLYATSGTKPAGPQQVGQRLFETDTFYYYTWTGAVWAIEPGQRLASASLGADTALSTAATVRDAGLSLAFTMPTLVGARRVKITTQVSNLRASGTSVDIAVRVGLSLTRSDNVEISRIQVVTGDEDFSTNDQPGISFIGLIDNTVIAGGVATTVKLRMETAAGGSWGLAAGSLMLAETI